MGKISFTNPPKYKFNFTYQVIDRDLNESIHYNDKMICHWHFPGKMPIFFRQLTPLYDMETLSIYHWLISVDIMSIVTVSFTYDDSETKAYVYDGPGDLSRLISEQYGPHNVTCSTFICFLLIESKNKVSLCHHVMYRAVKNNGLNITQIHLLDNNDHKSLYVSKNSSGHFTSVQLYNLSAVYPYHVYITMMQFEYQLRYDIHDTDECLFGGLIIGHEHKGQVTGLLSYCSSFRQEYQLPWNLTSAGQGLIIFLYQFPPYSSVDTLYLLIKTTTCMGVFLFPTIYLQNIFHITHSHLLSDSARDGGNLSFVSVLLSIHVPAHPLASWCFGYIF